MYRDTIPISNKDGLNIEHCLFFIISAYFKIHSLKMVKEITVINTKTIAYDIYLGQYGHTCQEFNSFSPIVDKNLTYPVVKYVNANIS